MSVNLATSPLQVTQHQMASRSDKYLSKRGRPKLVSWATADRICQVCLFAVEDAPALLRLVSQDLLVAKQVKMMHAVFAIDLHPGSESLSAKRAKIDMAAVLAMDAELSWKCPTSVLYNASWLVATGNDSSEVESQQHREIRTLEAFYPRVSAIPPSPIEPQIQESEEHNTTPFEIPIVPFEDEDVDYAGNASNDSSGKLSALFPQIDSDPDVAAAAAAAFAVSKAHEKGSLIDCDLLVKILSNPLLTEFLKHSNIGVPNVSNSTIATGGIAENAGAKGHLRSSIAQGRTYLPSQPKDFLHQQQGSPMQQLLGLNFGRTMHSQGTQEKEKGILGKGQNVYRINAPVNQPCQATSKTLFPSLQVQGLPANGTLRQSPFFNDRMGNRNILGSNCQPLLESNFNVSLSRKFAGTRPKAPASTKSRKPCLFVNTPKGCRNGEHCNFLHVSPALEQFPMNQSPKSSSATEDVQTTEGDEK